MDAHPTEDKPTNQMPMPFNWARDVNKSNGISPVVSMDTRPTEHIDKVMIPPPAIYGPCDLSTLCLGTRNLWGTLSHSHHRHHHSQSPCDLSTLSTTTQTPWNSDHHHHPCFYPSCPPPPHSDPPLHSMPIHIIEMVHHLQGIAPMKPVIHTMCHMPPFNSFQPSTFLKWQLPPVDTNQDPLCWLFTLCPPFSATVTPWYQFNRNDTPSGVLVHLGNNSHTHL